MDVLKNVKMAAIGNPIIKTTSFKNKVSRFINYTSHFVYVLIIKKYLSFYNKNMLNFHLTAEGSNFIVLAIQSPS